MENRLLRKPDPARSLSTPFAAAQSVLTISQPGDAAEREADAVAERVVGGSRLVGLPDTMFVQPAIQRKCAECEREVKEQSVHRKKNTRDTPVAGSFALKSQLEAARGQGSALPDHTRHHMESAYGTNFGGVRVHTDSQSVMMSRQLNAQAFTYGKDIYFDEGRFDTSSSSGQKLLAHELAHVVQQSVAVQRQIQRQATPEDAPPPPVRALRNDRRRLG